MRWLLAATVCLLVPMSPTAFAQMTDNDLSSYCQGMSEGWTAILLARTRGIRRSEAEVMLAKLQKVECACDQNPACIMTCYKALFDPPMETRWFIRMGKEMIDFAYSRPASTSIDVLRAELRNLCLAKKIFVQP